MKPVILLDMDNTMNRFWEHWVHHYNEVYNQNLRLDREDMINYNIAKCAKAKEPDKVRQTIFEIPGFWSSIPVYDDDMTDVVEQFYNEYDMYICTTPWHGYTECCSEKIQWVKKHLPFFDIDKMIFMKRKNMVVADLLIDDSPEVLETSSTDNLIIDFPYNRHIEGPRVKTWKEIKTFVYNKFKGDNT